MEGNTAAAAEPRSVLPQAALSLVLCIVLAGACLLSLWVGAQDISIATIMQSFTSYNAANVQEMIVQTLRFPRLLAALTCGASFAVAGAIMQGVTNNPMATSSPNASSVTERAIPIAMRSPRIVHGRIKRACSMRTPLMPPAVQ